MYALAEISDRIHIENRGKLLKEDHYYYYITLQKIISILEQIRKIIFHN